MRLFFAVLVAMGGAAAGLSAQSTPEIRGSLAPGQTQICVNLMDASAAAKLSVRVNGSPVDLKDPVSGAILGFTGPDATGLQQCLHLAQGLASGDEVIVRQQTDSVADSNAVTVPDPSDLAQVDLGRVRYTFSAGLVLANNPSQPGTQAALFLGLDADRAWLITNRRGWRRLGINTSFDVRLTSVATQGISASGTAPGALSAFLQSQKAGSLETGLSLPVITTEWRRGTASYAFFAAPIAKAGFTTLTDSSSISAAGTGRFFTATSYGARLGIFRTYKTAGGNWDENTAPETIGFLDLSTGRFGNFEVYRDLGAQEFLRQRPWRYSFEGILKIPRSALSVGFSANLGRGARPGDRVNGVVYPYTQAPDDLRFLFGVQFDFTKLLKAMTTF